MMSCLYIFQLCNCLHRLQIICSHQQTGLQSVRVHNKITFIVEEVQSIPIIFEHPSIKKLISYYTRNIGKSEMSTISHSALLLSVFGIGTFLEFQFHGTTVSCSSGGRELFELQHMTRLQVFFTQLLPRNKQNFNILIYNV